MVCGIAVEVSGGVAKYIQRCRFIPGLKASMSAKELPELSSKALLTLPLPPEELPTLVAGKEAPEAPRKSLESSKVSPFFAGAAKTVVAVNTAQTFSWSVLLEAATGSNDQPPEIWAESSSSVLVTVPSTVT